MKPSLQVRLSQHLALTPQLQQSIRLLQLSTLELHQEIEQMLESNPFIEVDEEAGPGPYDTLAAAGAATSSEVSAGERSMADEPWDGAADNALYFHARRVAPGWRMQKIASIGNHVFYR